MAPANDPSLALWIVIAIAVIAAVAAFVLPPKGDLSEYSEPKRKRRRTRQPRN